MIYIYICIQKYRWNPDESVDSKKIFELKPFLGGTPNHPNLDNFRYFNMLTY